MSNGNPAATPAAAATPTLTTGGLGRRLLVIALLTIAGVLLWISTGLDWGMAPVAWVPAVVLILACPSLWTRRRLTWTDNQVVIDVGHGIHTLPSADLNVELRPTAGLLAVLIHHPQAAEPIAVATWVGHARAEAIIAWLEQQGGQPIPRIDSETHPLDY